MTSWPLFFGGCKGALESSATYIAVCHPGNSFSIQLTSSFFVRGTTNIFVYCEPKGFGIPGIKFGWGA